MTTQRCFESGSALTLVVADSDPRGQKWLAKIEKVDKFHVLKCWMFSFEG